MKVIDHPARMEVGLLAAVGKEDVQKAGGMLKQYCSIKATVDDFKKYEAEIKATIYEGEKARRLSAEELYANKTANAVLLAQNQLVAAQKLELTKASIERAVDMIVDDEVKQVVTCRYIRGFSYSETMSFMGWGIKSATLDRRLKKGVSSVANTLKMWGVI